MRPSPTRFSGIPRLAALVTLIACAWLGAHEARAGCAHVSAARNASGEVSARFERLSLAGAIPVSAHPELPGRLPAPSPCPGGICSKAPVAPPVPAPMPVPQANQWAMLEGPTAACGPETLAALASESRTRPVRIGTSIFHPPRAGSSLALS